MRSFRVAIHFDLSLEENLHLASILGMAGLHMLNSAALINTKLEIKGELDSAAAFNFAFNMRTWVNGKLSKGLAADFALARRFRWFRTSKSHVSNVVVLWVCVTHGPSDRGSRVEYYRGPRIVLPVVVVR